LVQCPVFTQSVLDDVSTLVLLAWMLTQVTKIAEQKQQLFVEMSFYYVGGN